MSNEPKKRSRAWIGWTALALFVLYVVSSGPAFCLLQDAWRERDGVSIYYPVWWCVTKNDTALAAFESYLGFCRSLLP
jgi:hypothetical protein